MNKSKLLIAIAAMSSSVAFAGGTVRQAPVEAPAEVAPAPAPAPEVVAPAPAPAPVVVAPAFIPSWYVGASVGQSHYTQAGASDNETGYKVFGGYRFNPNFAAELSYIDLGRTSGSVKGQGASLDVLGILPVGYNFDIFGKVGVADLKADGAVNDSYKAGANYGIGASYHFNRNLSARVEAERFDKVGESQPVFGQAKANLYSVGLQYNF
jgi:OmpA-OmpF porin, OOP family